MDPIRIKQLLSSQVAPLSRVLGGVNVEQIKMRTLRRSLSYSQHDNKRLKMLMICALSLILFSWIAAAIHIVVK